MSYYKPLRRNIPRGQRFGANPGWGPNPAGGHNGDDYLSQVGEPIFAAGDGEVIHAGTFDSTYADNFGWNLNYGGNMVVLNLDGPEGPYVEYGHMDEIYVKAGQRVRAGQVIGTTGETDGGTNVITGPHLHVGCLPPNFDLNTSTYGRVNPDLYLTEYWDGSTLAFSGEITTPSEEDEMTKEQIDALIGRLDELNKAHHEATREHVNGKVGDIAKAVWKQPTDYRNPITGELVVGGTTPETVLSYFDTNVSRILSSASPQEIASLVPKEVAAEVVKLLTERMAN